MPPFYTPGGNPGTSTDVDSAPVRSEFTAIAAGFSQLVNPQLVQSYVPVASNYAQAVSNVSFLPCFYIRLGNLVLVWGQFGAGAGSGLGSFELNLPIPTVLGTNVYVCGGGISISTSTIAWSVQSGSNNNAKLSSGSNGSPSTTNNFWLLYPVA